MTAPEIDDPRSDEFLVEALNRGDNAAFEVLYRRYRDWVVQLAYRFTGNRDDALDVLQETFTYVFNKFPGFRLRAKMTTFLYPVVKHLSFAARAKSRRASPAPITDVEAPEVAEPAHSWRDELAAVVAVLPEAQREVLLMRVVDDMTLEESATALKIPLGTVKSRLHIAIQTLREDGRTRRYFEV